MKQRRNEKCKCGSGLKYKKCCGLVEEHKQAEALIEGRTKKANRNNVRRRVQV